MPHRDHDARSRALLTLHRATDHPALLHPLPMRTILVLAQTATFIGLGALLLAHHEWRLALAQALLAGVTATVYL